MNLLRLAAAAVAFAAVAAASASAQVLSPPPPAQGPTANAIFDAMLAIARAAESNPRAAQTATFSYQAAIQQYEARDFARARQSAITAIAQAGAPALPQDVLHPSAIPQPSYAPMPLVVNVDEATAESNVALARHALTACGAPGAAPPAAAVQHYASAAAALTGKNYRAANADAASVVNACAAELQAYEKQQAALPRPSATPMPLPSYSPVPVATLVPDPALQSPAP